MKEYTKNELNQNNKKKLVTDWAYKEGVFQMRNNKWIARVRKGSSLTTLSQHNTQEDAQVVYDNFYKGITKKD